MTNLPTPPEDWLEKEMDEALSGEFFESSPGAFYASNLGDDPRMLLFKYLGLIKDPIEASLARKLHAGTAIHNQWEEELKEADVLLAAEVDVKKHPILPVRGRLDFIVRRKEDKPDAKFLIELKTTSPNIWEGLREPLYGAVAQWSWYSRQEEIPNGYIIYVSYVNVYGRRWEWKGKYFQALRDDKDVHIFLGGKRVNSWPDFLGKLDEKLYYVLWCVENDALPSKCQECVWGKCKYPEICEGTFKGKNVVSLEKWKESTRR